MLAATACRALRDARRLHIPYGGHERTIEVHAVGRSGKGRHVMLAWQVRGGSASGASSGWKMLRLDEVRSSRIVDEPSDAPRPGYRRDEGTMTGGIICQL